MVRAERPTRMRAPGGLVHLAVAERHLRLGKFVSVDHAGFLEFLVEVVPFTGAFANATEHRHTAMFFGDVVDQFLDQNGFAHTSTTEQANFSAFTVRSQQVDHLDAGFKHFRLGLQLSELGSVTVNWSSGLSFYRTLLVNGFTEDVEDATQSGFADGD